MAEMPAGIVTFLFTDIEGSVRLWERQPDSMRRLLDHHNAVLHAVIDKHRGYVFKEWGDQFCAVFAEAQDAAAAAVETQSLLHEEVPQVRVRMALHSGTAELIKGDYFGPALGHVARLLAAGHGGQILVSRATAELLDSEVPSDSSLHLLGTHRLRDIPESETIFHLSVEGLPNEFPPLNTLDVAFRRGMRRALALSSIVLTVMAGLLVSALFERHRADRNAGLAAANYRAAIRQLALNQTEQGVKQLEEGNGLGLLDLVRARETADPLPDLRDAIASVWAGWHQSLAGRLITEVGHDRAVLDVKFSPDGKLLATASEDNTVRLWDTRTWEMATPPLQHDAPVRLVTFSPDGKLVATAAGDHAWLWDAATGELRAGPLQHAARVTGVAFSPDGEYLASASIDLGVRLWNAQTGGPRGPCLHIPASSSPGSFLGVLVGFGPSPGRPLVIATSTRVLLWDALGDRSVTLLHRSEDVPSCEPVLGLSPDGTVRAVAANTAAWAWSREKGRFLPVAFSQPKTINCLAVSPDGGLLAAAGWSDPAVRIFDITAGGRPLPPFSHPAGVDALAFGPSGRNLLVTLSRGTVRVWDTSSGRLYQHPSPPQKGNSRFALDSTGRTLATVGANGTVEVWSLSAVPRAQRLSGLARIGCVAFREGDGVLTVVSSKDLNLYSAGTGRLVSTQPGIAASRASLISEDGGILAGWGGNEVSLWQTRTGRANGPPLRLSQRIRYVALSRRGTVLATICQASMVRLWDAATGEPRGGALRHLSSVSRIEFSPDERLLATAAGNVVRLWDTVTGRLCGPPLKLTGPPSWLSFSPDSRQLAVAVFGDRTLTLWSTSTGHLCLQALKHPAPVTLGAFSPDGKQIASVTEENATRLWDVASGQLCGRIMPQPDLVEVIRFSPDGKRLATVTHSGAGLWDLTTGQLMSSPVLPGEQVWDVRFDPNGAALALITTRAGYLWHLPAAPTDLRSMRLLTSTALGVAPGAGSDGDALSWQAWRRVRDRVQGPGVQSPPPDDIRRGPPDPD